MPQRRKMNSSTIMPCKIQLPWMPFFLAIGIFFFRQSSPTRHRLRFTPPTWRGCSHFFKIQNDCKRCSLVYLDGLGHFLFGFWAAWKIAPPPFGKKKFKKRKKCQYFILHMYKHLHTLSIYSKAERKYWYLD